MLACVLVLGILVGIAVGRAQVVEEQHTWEVNPIGLVTGDTLMQVAA
jgi:hypothetical protein